MGQDKAMLPVVGKSLLEHHINMMSPEVGQLFLAANRSYEVVDSIEITSIADYYTQPEGPLSGLLAALQASKAEYLWVVSCDNYGLTVEVKNRLFAAIQGADADVACLNINGRTQPLIATLKTSLHQSLLAYLESGERSVMKWFAELSVVSVDALIGDGLCYNINTPEDYQGLLDSL